MKKLSFILFCLALGLFSKLNANPVTVKSPDGQLELKFEVVDGIPHYSLDRAVDRWFCGEYGPLHRKKGHGDANPFPPLR